MRHGLRWGSIAFALIVLLGCSNGGGEMRAPEPLKAIDAAQFFTGRWYEIARTPMKLTDGCVAGTTDYFRRPDGTLIDRDACRMTTPAGEEKTYQGPVTILDPATDAKISVRYTVWGFFPVTRVYWILDHGDDWFIVSNPGFTEISLFTRAPRPPTDAVRMLVARARALGYDTGKLEFPTQFPPGEQ